MDVMTDVLFIFDKKNGCFMIQFLFPPLEEQNRRLLRSHDFYNIFPHISPFPLSVVEKRHAERLPACRPAARSCYPLVGNTLIIRSKIKCPRLCIGKVLNL